MNATARAFAALIIMAGGGLAYAVRSCPPEKPTRVVVRDCRYFPEMTAIVGRCRAVPAMDRHRALAVAARRRAANANNLK